MKETTEHLKSAGHRGHGTGRILETTMCTDRKVGMHDGRTRQLPDGAMTGGNQPTNIRGIDRRRKVQEARCLEVPAVLNCRGP